MEYKLIKGNQANFEALLNELAVEDIIQFCCNGDASYFAALIKIDEAYLEKEKKAAETKVKAELAAKAKADKAAKVAREAELKKELAAIEKAKKAEAVE